MRLFALALIATVLAVAAIPVSVIEVRMGGETVVLLPLLSVRYAMLSFIHSSELTPWMEVWRLTPSGVEVVEVCVASGGAGQPALLKDFNSRNVALLFNGSMMCFSNVDRHLGSRVVLCGRTAINMRLAIDSKVLDVRECVVLSIKRVRLAHLFIFLTSNHLR